MLHSPLLVSCASPLGNTLSGLCEAALHTPFFLPFFQY